MTADPSVSQKLRRLSENWAIDAAPKLAELAELLSELAQTETVDTDRLKSTIRLTHGLAGGAGIVGHPEISKTLLPLEGRLAKIAGRAGLSAYDRRVIRRLIRAIPKLIAGLAL